MICLSGVSSDVMAAPDRSIIFGQKYEQVLICFPEERALPEERIENGCILFGDPSSFF